MRSIALTLSAATILASQAWAQAGTTVDVELVEWDIVMPEQIAAGEVTFVVTNGGSMVHQFEIENEETGFERMFDQQLQPGETMEMTVTLEPGDYYVYCPIANHAARGMELTLNVTGGA